MFTSKTKSILEVVSALVVAVLVHIEPSLIPTAFAQAVAAGAGTAVRGSIGDDLVRFTSHLAAINTFFHVLLLVILDLLGYLLQADFLNDPKMMASLNTIWQLSRNIMNIFFALMLVGVSFYVIITSKSDMIKEKLVNFVVAVILVNFSWFFPRVIIDVANVLTATVYSVPNLIPNFTCQVQNPKNPNTPDKCKVISAATLFPTNAEARNFCSTNNGGAPGSATCPCITGLECHVIQDFDVAVRTMKPAHAMINGMAVSFVKISQLAKVPTTVARPGPVGGGTGVRVSIQILINIVMAFAVQLAILLPLIAMAVGFLIRIVILWITIAFMPFTFLGYVVNGKLGTNVFDFEVDVWKEFMQAAFLPAVVGVPMVIGFVMLSTVGGIPPPPGMVQMNVPLLSGVTNWWAILWLLAAVGIMWVGAFKALAKNQIIGKFTEKIRGFGEYVGGGIAQLPLLTPLPLPGGNRSGANLGTLVHGPKIISDSIRVAASGTTGKKLGEIIGERLGAGRADADTVALAANNRDNTQKIVAALKELQKTGLTAEQRNNQIQIIQNATGTSGRTSAETLQLLNSAIKSNKLTDAEFRKPEFRKVIEDEIRRVGGTV
jgi:hypothetical protein